MPSSATTRQTAADVVVLVSRLRRRLRAASHLEDLTPSQLSVVSRLSREGDSSAAELAERERVRPQSMAATLAALDERGLITRHPDARDGRRQVVTLTGQAQQILASDRAERRDWLAGALDQRLTADERRVVRTAIALLEKVIDE